MTAYSVLGRVFIKLSTENAYQSSDLVANGGDMGGPHKVRSDEHT